MTISDDIYDMHKNHRSRMREKFKRSGLAGFEDHEILEQLLYQAIPRRDTNELSHTLIRKFGGIPEILVASEEELCSVHGIGERSAATIRFFGSLFCEITKKLFEKIPVTNDSEAGIYAAMRMGTAPDGSAAAAYFDCDGIRLADEELNFEGRIMTDRIVPHIIDTAVENGASAILLMHSHGGDSNEPSADDMIITKELRERAEKIGVCVRHVIISQSGHRII